MTLNYVEHLLILVAIFSILALSLQLALGFTGLLNLGHIAFYAVGAYVSAILSRSGFPFAADFLAAGLVAMLFGYCLSGATRKLKGDYLALVTLGFSFVIYAVLMNWMSITNGPIGLSDISKPVFLGIHFDSKPSFLALAAVVAILSYFIIKKIVLSPFGKVLEAIRDDELSARLLGKNTRKLKSIALEISAFFAGITGSLFAHYLSFIDPTSFTVSELISVLAIVILGGLASLEGTILATVVIVILPELFRFINISTSAIGPLRQVFYALLLLMILIYKPKGLHGEVNLE